MNILKLKEVLQYDIDSPERTLAHGKVIRRKKFLYRLYKEWYSELLTISGYTNSKHFIELGSGACIIKDFAPNIITSDVLALPNIDKIIFSDSIPYESKSLDGIIMIDVLHHMPDIRKFIIEADRVLKIGGCVIMSEPWNCSWSNFIYSLFHHEPFNVTGDWTIPYSGPLSGANGALPWIVFCRDRSIFNKEFPNFEIAAIKPHTATRYLLSGGVSMKQLVPNWSFSIFKILDNIINKINFSMFAYIMIKKVK